MIKGAWLTGFRDCVGRLGRLGPSYAKASEGTGTGRTGTLLRQGFGGHGDWEDWEDWEYRTVRA